MTEYQYKELDQSKNEIRLMRLLPHEYHENSLSLPPMCSLFIVSLDQVPEYEALSYTWGDPCELSHICLDGHRVEVRKNLEGALCQLRNRTTSKVLWIDAICIDQMNEEERGPQVAKMKIIYAYASKVLVWLGESLDNSDLAFSLLNDIHERLHNEASIQEILKSPEGLKNLEGLSLLFSREYWSRVWVIQEVNFARRISVHCGTSTMDWNDMLAVQDILRKKFGSLLVHLSAVHWPLRDLRQSVYFKGPQSLLLDRVDSSSNARILDLFDALMMHRLKRSTDPRDKIYALVGLTAARDDPEYVIDYTLSVRQVYTNTADYLVRRSQHLDIICAKTKTRGTESFDLPTWAPNWASPSSTCPVPYRHAVPQSVYSASGTRKADAHVSCKDGILTARGVCISSVKAVGQISGMADKADYYHSITAFHAWYKFLTPKLGHGTEQSEDFSRLLLCDIIDPEDLVGRTLSNFLLSVLGVIVKYGHQRWPDIAVDPRLTRFAESVAESESMVRSWVEIISQIIFKRRLFITTQGDLGPAEESTMDGDIVCILFGCSIPVVLREVHGHYIYISDACVVGYMYGKGVDELEKGKFQPQTFEIH